MAENLKHWKDFQAQLISILITAIIICIISLVYYKKITNKKKNEQLSGFVILMGMFIISIENIIVNVMGNRFKKLTPYGMYLVMYIFLSCVISLIGLESLATSYTVTFSMGLVTFFGIYYYGLRYQKLLFFKKFLNPVELITQFVPLISISFRLFGNILAGGIILGLLYSFLIGLQGVWSDQKSIALSLTNEPGIDVTNIKKGWLNNDIFNSIENGYDFTWDAQYKYFWTGINPMSTLVMPWLHLFFDLFDGLIQSLVFTILTFNYWAEAKGHHEQKTSVETKDDQQNRKENYEAVVNQSTIVSNTMPTSASTRL